MIEPITKINHRRRLLVVGAAAAVIALTALTVPAAQAADQNTADAPGFTVEPIGIPLEAGYTRENYIHPGADLLAARTGIALKDGDGQLMYTECSTDPNLIRVDRVIENTTIDRQIICFKLIGNTGWLTMEIPDSFNVRAGKEVPVTVITTDPDNPEAKPKETPVDKNNRADITNTSNNNVTIVELRVK